MQSHITTTRIQSRVIDFLKPRDWWKHQKELYNNFIDFKKAFDRVLKEYNINNWLIKSLYDEVTSAMPINGNLQYFLEKIMQKALTHR